MLIGGHDRRNGIGRGSRISMDARWIVSVIADYG
jgi:hypothetical protein